MNKEDVEAIAQAVAEKLEGRIGAVTLDWGRVNVDTPINPRPQSGKLDPTTMFKLQVIANKGYEGSMASVIKTAVMCYIRSKWEKHLEDILPIAAREDISVEECLNKIVSGDIKL